MLTRRNAFEQLAKSDFLKIVVLCSLFYVILHFIRITFLISGKNTDWFTVHIWNALILPSGFSAFVKQLWSLISYMFVEMSFMKLLGNMIWLWIFSNVLEDLKGAQQVFPVFLVGGIVGAIFFLIGNQFAISSNVRYLSGTDASLCAVAIATVMFRPTYRFWIFAISIPIWVLFAIFIALKLTTIGEYNLSMLYWYGGALVVGVGYNSFLSGFFDKVSSVFLNAEHYLANNENFLKKKKQTNTLRGKVDYKPFEKHLTIEQRIDQLLDKINEKGYQSLTEQEKKFLKDHSKSI